jgi:hypothetical protein
VTVILLGFLSVLNAVAVAALIRQVGVLHLRIRPVAGMQGGGGPGPGTQLALPGVLSNLARRRTPHVLIGFLSPTCGVCGPLATAFGKLGKTADPNTAILLVIDATEERAREYLREKHIDHLPHLADSGAFKANVPGAPWAVVADETGVVIASGGVNTLENIEELMAQADEFVREPSDRAEPSQLATFHHSTEAVQDVS